MSRYRSSLGIALIMLFALPLTASAHPGNTDAYGCHTCRTNCAKWGLSTGEYHCHRAKALPQPEEPIRSHSDGTTELWPEYKNPSPTVTPVSTPKPTTPTVNTTATAKITFSLAKGMENNQVLRLQQILTRYPDIYPEGLITGYFGSATERAAKRFQKRNGLEQTGAIGPKTRALLNTL